MEEYSSFKQVTSASEPWKKGGRLAICKDCGTAQAVCDDTWGKNCGEIYANYPLFHQADGELDQTIFDSKTGLSLPRSEMVLSKLKPLLHLPETKRSLLDIGCGRGAMLHAASKSFPKWKLWGQDFSRQHASEVLGMPSVKAFFTCPVHEIEQSFDIITMEHVLEHIKDPVAFLKEIHPVLAPGGVIIIQVPDCGVNPYMLLVADHSSHFDADTLQQVFEQAGFKVLVKPSNLVPKELTIVAESSQTHGGAGFSSTLYESSRQKITRHLSLLTNIRSFAERLVKAASLGVFGTSTAGIWLHSEVEGISFYVDEDSKRTGKPLYGKMVYDVDSCPRDADVIVPLVPEIARQVAARLQPRRPDLKFHLPD